MSKVAISGGLPTPGQPFSWGLKRGRMLFTNHGPVTQDGRILDGTIAEQAALTLKNMRAVLEEAGGSLADVMQVTIFLLDGADMAPVDEIYRTFFTAPYPTRASLIVAGLVAPGMRIELSAAAIIGEE